MFYVIAKKYDADQEKQIEYIAGTFPTFINAAIFRDAYIAHYGSDTDARISGEYGLLNK